MASFEQTPSQTPGQAPSQAPDTAWPDDPALAAVLDAFAAAECCWFASVRPDGRAHLAPIWHVWCDHRAFVVTQRRSVRAANIRRNPAVSLALPDPMNPIILEGRAFPAPEYAAQLQPLFLAKYKWDISTDADYNDVIAVAPLKLMAWGSHGEQRWQLG